MFYRAAFVLLAWTATASGAVIAGLGAISVLGEGITDRTVDPMTSAQVREALTRPEPTTPRPSPSPGRATRRPQSSLRTTVPPAGTVRSLSSSGGDVLARCVRDSAYLLSWSPTQGYGAGDVRRGPADTVFVEFESGRRKMTMVVTCRDGRPVAVVRSERHPRRDDGNQDH
ncbi:hypothetical protein [Actinoallomurus sp. CA-150999]|uniref:hypothetical protein n=1 Tax=Actinoallomurus sp. CA-150999 TaxID=3239887 RepID=UPI003D94B421